jgi:hypothetical protein
VAKGCVSTIFFSILGKMSGFLHECLKIKGLWPKRLLAAAAAAETGEKGARGLKKDWDGMNIS